MLKAPKWVVKLSRRPIAKSSNENVEQISERSETWPMSFNLDENLVMHVRARNISHTYSRNRKPQRVVQEDQISGSLSSDRKYASNVS